MKTISLIKTELEAIKVAENALMDEMKASFLHELELLKEKFKGLISHARVGINNHEFNDGDQTSFYIQYEDMEVFYFDGDDEKSYVDKYGDPAPQNVMDAKNELEEFFGSYDTNDFYEKIYGDVYEEFEITFP